MTRAETRGGPSASATQIFAAAFYAGGFTSKGLPAPVTFFIRDAGAIARAEDRDARARLTIDCRCNECASVIETARIYSLAMLI